MKEVGPVLPFLEREHSRCKMYCKTERISNKQQRKITLRSLRNNVGEKLALMNDNVLTILSKVCHQKWWMRKAKR